MTDIDPYQKGCVNSARLLLKEMKKTVKELDRTLDDKDPQEIKMAYLATVMLSSYMKKQLSIDCLKVLTDMEEKKSKFKSEEVILNGKIIK